MKVLAIACYLTTMITIEASSLQASPIAMESLPNYVRTTAADLVSKLLPSAEITLKNEIDILKDDRFAKILGKLSVNYNNNNDSVGKYEKQSTEENIENDSNETEHKNDDADISKQSGAKALLTFLRNVDKLQSLIGKRDNQTDLYQEMNSDIPPLVSTTYGVLKGLRINKNGVTYSSFRGIPYVSPPARFQAAKPPEPWDDIRDATKDGNVCIQKIPAFDSVIGSEDCLYLSVHTPSTLSVGLPVLVLIHGGLYKQLTGNSILYGPEKIVKANVVYVSFNYRLGALGFLSTNTFGAPGNAGMKDMIAALKWVQMNIHSFGGDPHKVTLYGGSTGATAVEYMTLSKMAEGLFSQTITQSCSALNYWAYAEEPLKFAYRLGKYLGSYKSDVDELLDFLRKAKAEDIIEASDKLATDELPTKDFIPFLPCVESGIPGEETFLSDTPENILKSGDFIKVPSMIGFNDFEGSEFLKQLYDDAEYLNNIDESFEYLMPNDLMAQLRSPREKKEALRRVRQFYLNGDRISNSTVMGYVQMMGDSKFLRGLFKSVSIRMEKSSSPIYLWEFAYSGEYGVFRNYIDVEINGAAHGDEIGYVFNLPFSDGIKKSNKTEEVSQRLLKMMTNFLMWGNPTPSITELLPVTWKPIQSKETMDYMKFSDTMELKQKPYKRRLLFWENLYDSVNYLH